MIKLYDNGVYLLNGTEIVESPEEAPEPGRKYPGKRRLSRPWPTIS